jgi:hypothetical protein
MKLFDGDDKIFKSAVKDSKLYFEYGCGDSTKWVLNNTDSKIVCTDSSIEWLNTIPNNSRVVKIYVNIGPLKDWGYPIDNSQIHNWPQYQKRIWEYPEKPDTVLIDGRFRVACFLTTLKYADKGTIILFDDYVNRDYYHIIEKYSKPITTYGRQAMFITKQNFDINELNNDLEIYSIDLR